MIRLAKSLREFCEGQELLRLAFIGAEGYPRIVPLWFSIVNGGYCCGTDAASPKWKAIQRNPKIGWVIDGGPNRRYRGVSSWGYAEEITDPRSRAAVYRSLSIKYFGAPKHPKFVELYGDVDDPETIYFRLKEEDGFSWEY